ncbi:hypothetical protein [Bacillus sp. CGMCC 1.16541]|uniref:hypothetical protein n=1 Tax=Bacillus sp. CGMCC 1.16541 TaxID=2185143 RepID=UPI000D738149|nr:hypothetical protein [Bacillus sp. CGMCC 1.16541]
MTKLPLISFLSSFLCIGLFFISATLSIESNWPIHPLLIVLLLTTGVFFMSLFSVAGVCDWKSSIQSVSAIVLTLGLAIFLLLVLSLGSLGTY